jgi:predicted permease
MMTMLQDLIDALRQLARKPGFTITAVLTLAIGLGVNAVAFSVVNGLVFKATIGRGLAGTGRIATMPGGDESGDASLAEMERFVDATRGSLEVAAEGRSSAAWRHDGTTDTAWVLYVTDNYFSLVNAPVVAGQLHVARSAGDSPAAVIGERFWRDRLGSASLAGLTLRLNNREVIVAGVIAESYTGPAGIYSPDVWLPLADLTLFSPSPAVQKVDTRWLFLFGRLLPGASVPAVQAQIAAAAAGMARTWPDTHKMRGAEFWMLDRGNRELRSLRTGAAILMGIIGVVLLLACFNVANLLLARAVERERDLGIRTALGATPGRLIRMVLCEGLAIAALSGLVALLIAWWTQSLVRSFAIPIQEPQHVDLTPDGTVVAFLTALVAIAGVLPGLVPALSAARVDVLRVLGSHGSSAARRPARLRQWLVGVQVAGSTVFLTLAALLVQSYAHLSEVDLGFERDRLIVAELDPASHGYDAARTERYLDLLSSRLRALPGISRVAVVDRAPFFIGFDRTSRIWPASGSCEPAGCPAYATYAVAPGYFSTKGIALAEGREFDRNQPAGTVVINAALAEKHFPGGDALGQTLRIGETGATVTVVGIAANSHTRGLDRVQPVLYVPLSPAQLEGPLTLVARADAPAATLVRPVQEAALAVDPNIAMIAVKTMTERSAVQLWPFRTVSKMFIICGALALILATVGLAGVVSHAVSRRMREFGVRLSIGATEWRLTTDVLRGSARLLAPGLGAGVIVAAILARVARVALVGVNVLNPTTYVAVVLLQSAVVVVACLRPARRASRADPLIALRSE